MSGSAVIGCNIAEVTAVRSIPFKHFQFGDRKCHGWIGIIDNREVRGLGIYDHDAVYIRYLRSIPPQIHPLSIDSVPIDIRQEITELQTVVKRTVLIISIRIGEYCRRGFLFGCTFFKITLVFVIQIHGRNKIVYTVFRRPGIVRII